MQSINVFKFEFVLGGGGGAIWPLPRAGGAEESRPVPIDGHAPSSGPEIKNGRNSA